MRFSNTLLATAVILLASSDSLIDAKTTQASGLYADLYCVKDGIVLDKMRAPLGDAEQYETFNGNKLDSVGTNDQEERKAPRMLAEGKSP
ncbi:unnamed protein product [Phytophthora lilii]|uniref:Unnamed protein product n=1 Tax=Phytophthora lilii TaxID=2077276 RepID=A0A9W6XGB9_9STRA|nr:unnamed protein product [Phytophthora lilii]